MTTTLPSRVFAPEKAAPPLIAPQPLPAAPPLIAPQPLPAAPPRLEPAPPKVEAEAQPSRKKSWLLAIPVLVAAALVAWAISSRVASPPETHSQNSAPSSGNAHSSDSELPPLPSVVSTPVLTPRSPLIASAPAGTGAPEGTGAPAGKSAPAGTGAPAGTSAQAPAAAPAPPTKSAASPQADPVFFGFGSPVPRLSGPELAELARRVSACPGRIVLTGHTCDIGLESENRALALERARRVRLLLTREGIRAERFDLRATAKAEAPAFGGSEEMRAKNRRVSVTCEPE